MVEFNAEILLDKVPVTPELKIYYEMQIQSIIEKQYGYLDTSNVERIIIPNDFVSDVLDFQRSLFIERPFVTDNDFGRALGKMLYDSINKKYYIFIDSQIATFLMDDTLFNTCFKDLDEVNKCMVFSQRDYAFNLLAHELAHIEFHSNATTPVLTAMYDDQIISLLHHLFDEYYACRRSAVFPSDHYSSYNEGYIRGIEDRIIEEKWKYKRRENDLNKFVILFHDLTKQSLLGMVSVLGSLSGDPLQQPQFANCKLEVIINDFTVEFDNIYETFIERKEISFSPLLSSAIRKYFDSFSVFITQQTEGIYYDIP